MSEEPVPPQGGPSSGQPKGLLQQMEELMAALNADLSALDADLQRPPRIEADHLGQDLLPVLASPRGPPPSP
ncbi:hypothetical protein [Streptomyces sp. NPDC001076]